MEAREWGPSATHRPPMTSARSYMEQTVVGHVIRKPAEVGRRARFSLGEVPEARMVLSRVGATKSGKYKLLNDSHISNLVPKGARSRGETQASPASVSFLRTELCSSWLLVIPRPFPKGQEGTL